MATSLGESGVSDLAMLGVAAAGVIGVGWLLSRGSQPTTTQATTRSRQSFDGTSPGVPLLVAPGDSSSANTITRLPFASPVTLLGGAISGPCPSDWLAQPNCGDGNGNTYYAVQGGGYLRRYDLAS